MISEYDQTDWKGTYVYAGAQRIGMLSKVGADSPRNYWRANDLVTGDEISTSDNGMLSGQTSFDPQGVEVGFQDPFPPAGEESGECVEHDPSHVPNEPVAAGLIPDGSSAKCIVDGIQADCQSIGSHTMVQCPDNDCGPRMRKDGTLSQRFQAFADGHSGFLPPGTHYIGNGRYADGGPPGDRREGVLEEDDFADLFPQNTQQLPTGQNLDRILELLRLGEAVAQGIDQARQAFQQNPMCRALFFGTNPLTLLSTYTSNGLISAGTSYRELQPGGGMRQVNFTSADVGAVTSTAAGSYPGSTPRVRISANPITINENGFYFSGNNSAGVAVNTLQRAGFRGLSLAQIRGAVIIHELLHAAGRIPSDGTNPTQSQANSELVRRFCFPNRPVTTITTPLATLP